MFRDEQDKLIIFNHHTIHGLLRVNNGEGTSVNDCIEISQFVVMAAIKERGKNKDSEVLASIWLGDNCRRWYFILVDTSSGDVRKVEAPKIWAKCSQDFHIPVNKEVVILYYKKWIAESKWQFSEERLDRRFGIDTTKNIRTMGMSLTMRTLQKLYPEHETFTKPCRPASEVVGDDDNDEDYVEPQRNGTTKTQLGRARAKPKAYIPSVNNAKTTRNTRSRTSPILNDNSFDDSENYDYISEPWITPTGVSRRIPVHQKDSGMKFQRCNNDSVSMADVQTLISQSLENQFAKFANTHQSMAAPETVASLIRPKLASVKEVVEGVKEGFESLMSMRDVLLSVGGPITPTAPASFAVAANIAVDISAVDRQHQLDLDLVKKNAAEEKALLLLQLEQRTKDTELLRSGMESERVAREEATRKWEEKDYARREAEKREVERKEARDRQDRDDKEARDRQDREDLRKEREEERERDLSMRWSVKRLGIDRIGKI